MTCAESAERMSELLDGLPSEALEIHLTACPACRAELESTRRAHEALRRHPSLEWRPALTDAILRRARRPRWPWIAAAAAAVLLAALLWPRSPALPREALARHVSAVRVLAKGLGGVDRDVLGCQFEQLRLPELTREVSRAAGAPEGYLAACRAPLQSPEDVARLWTSAQELQERCALPTVPARIEPPSAPTPAGLFAAGRLRAANGDAAASLGCFDELLNRHPDSAYADASCVALAEHFTTTGDLVSALAFYASIRRPETITPELATAIRGTAARAGRAFAGPRPMAEADVEHLRRCAEGRTPYGLVRGSEAWLLGPIPPEIPRAAPFPMACASLTERKVRVDLSAAAPAHLREMLGSMRALAK